MSAATPRRLVIAAIAAASLAALTLPIAPAQAQVWIGAPGWVYPAYPYGYVYPAYPYGYVYPPYVYWDPYAHWTGDSHSLH